MPKISTCLILLWILTGCSGADDDASWTTKNIDTSIAAGNRITDMLVRFYGKHKAFPGKLSDLIPEEGTSIPLPLVGEKFWDYEEHGNDFYLGFQSRKLMDGYFRTLNGRWVETKGDDL